MSFRFNKRCPSSISIYCLLHIPPWPSRSVATLCTLTQRTWLSGAFPPAWASTRTQSVRATPLSSTRYLRQCLARKRKECSPVAHGAAGFNMDAATAATMRGHRGSFIKPVRMPIRIPCEPPTLHARCRRRECRRARASGGQSTATTSPLSGRPHVCERGMPVREEKKSRN